MISFLLIGLTLLLILSLLLKFRMLTWLTTGSIAAVFILMASGVLTNYLLAGLQSFPYKQAKLVFKSSNAIILLGGGVANVSKKVLLPSMLTYSRITAAAQTYLACKKAGKNCVIITSGGDLRQSGESEAHVYKTEFIKLGINADDIKSESKSRNTYQNAEFSSRLINSANYNQIFLVTSGIHMQRSLLSFQHFGISAIPVASDFMQAKSSIFALGYNFSLTDAALHEYLGIIKYLYFDFKNGPLHLSNFINPIKST